MATSQYRTVAMSQYRTVAMSQYRTVAMSQYRTVAMSQYRTVAMSQYRTVAMYIQLHPHRRFFLEPNYGSSLYYAQNEREDEARWPTEPARRYSAIMACFCLSPYSDPYFSGSRPLRVTTKTTWKSLLSDTCWRYESLQTDICGTVIYSSHNKQAQPVMHTNKRSCMPCCVNV